jgi:hypothetical protein
LGYVSDADDGPAQRRSRRTPRRRGQKGRPIPLGVHPQVLSERLAELDTNAKIEQWVEGYRRIPPGTVDEWGDLEAEADDAGRRMARDLDEEERRAGFSW